jgi:hypothetical protein
MPERHKLEPAYDPADWRDAETGDSGDDPLAELARLVQGIGNDPDPVSRPLRPAPPRYESGAPRPQPAMRYDTFPSSTRGETAPVVPPGAPVRDTRTADLASDLEAELMRDLQASFNAVRAPMESAKAPEIPTPNLDDLDFDAFADLHYRRNAPMETSPPPNAGIESLATWREPTRPRPKPAQSSFRQRLESAAETAASPRIADDLHYGPADPLAVDPEIAAVAAAAESFSQVSADRTREPAPNSYEASDDGREYSHVPGYAEPSEEDAHDDRRARLHAPPSGRRPLVLVGGVLGVVIVGAIGFFAISGFNGGGDAAPPVIAADPGPVKVRPESPGGSATATEQSKLIYDRVGNDAPDTALAPDRTVTTVTRPEAQQTEASREISRIILPDPADPAMTDEPLPDSESAAVGPKRVRTVVVRPDGTIVSSTAAPAAPAAALEPAPSVAASPTPQSTSPAAAPREIAAAPAARPVADRPTAPAISDEPADLGFAGDDWESGDPLPAEEPVAAAPSRPAAEATPSAQKSTGPISLLPKSGDAASEPARVAAVEPAPEKPTTAPAATGSYFVQVSSQRTEAAALAAYREVQRRFPSVLGDREPDIQRADLGSRGVYYRARVSPGLSASAANSLCASLKSAGGDCIVTQN